jgi:hypothetical protein
MIRFQPWAGSLAQPKHKEAIPMTLPGSLDVPWSHNETARDSSLVTPVGQAGAVPAAGHAMLFVQSMRGAPASVLLALGFAGRYMSQKELLLWTRCGHMQVAFALKTLAALGWVVARTSRGPWALAADRQLPVEPFFGDGSALKALNDNDDSDPPMAKENKSLSARREHLLQVLARHGIEEPTASELADLPYVTRDYVRAHIEAARTKGLRVGVAIQRMRMAVPAPPTPPSRKRQASRERAAEVEGKIRRFIEGG